MTLAVKRKRERRFFGSLRYLDISPSKKNAKSNGPSSKKRIKPTLQTIDIQLEPLDAAGIQDMSQDERLALQFTTIERDDSKEIYQEDDNADLRLQLRHAKGT